MIVARERQNHTATRYPPRTHATRPSKPAGLGPFQAALLSTAWGVCGVVWKCAPDESASPAAFVERPRTALLCRILTPGLAVDELRQRLLGTFARCSEVIADRRGNFHPEIVPAWFPELAQRLEGYYSTRLRTPIRPDFSDSWHLWRWRLDWTQLTPFQRGVLEITASIPRGSRQTYGQVATTLGKPRATRAVGAALGSNPWPVLIPCHRVVGANGAMTGFSAPGGVGVKARMLAMEARG